ncbi:MAG: DUF4259 domain-containing protein [Rhizomicrobium sp.]
MGAWGKGPLENDDACDYADAVADGTDLSPVERTLDKAVKANGSYLEASDGAEALAAGEIVARLLGRPGELTPRTAKIDEWIESKKVAPSSQLIDKAKRAVSRVITEPSELMELWIDSDDFDSWQSSVEDLIQRLSS